MEVDKAIAINMGVDVRGITKSSVQRQLNNKYAATREKAKRNIRIQCIKDGCCNKEKQNAIVGEMVKNLD